MRRYTTLLLDADETLLDFTAAETVAIKTVCEQFDIEFNEEIRKTYSKINLSLWKQLEKGLVTREIIKIRRFEQFAELVGSCAPPAQMADCYIKALSKCGMTLSGANKLCATLSQKYDMYIVTNGLAVVQNSRLKACGLLPYFKGIFISEEMGSQKPEKLFFDLVFNNIPEKDKTKICIIGDSMTSDILGGINAGIDTCFYSPCDSDLLYKPTYIAKSYDDIIKIFTETEN